MRIKNFMTMATVVLSMVACSNDDNESVQYSELYKAVSGSYTVYTSASVMGTAVVTNNEKVEIVANGNGSVAALNYSGVWGEGQTSELSVTKENGQYVVSGTGTIAASMGDGTHSGSYDFTVDGTVSEDKKNVSLTFSIELGGMGTVTVTSASGYAPATVFLPDTYKGYTSAAFAYSPTPIVTADETVTVTANENGTVNVVMASSTWGTATISNVAVEVEDGIYTLKGEGTSAMAMGGGTPKEYPCTLEGTISGDKEDVDMAFSLSIMGGTTITFRLGDAPEEQE
ncbi:MAG: calycin-like domain-containing protein [Bacteroides sp.]|nr:calycin-like domain-containing protein [Roseburia sp.]MCM1347358.1 calycin-like domain-containing protein [Bacteroides sp.]MCM1421876.1 calycin-like domain-containing protein [Bacteroides sp.]